MRTRTLAPTALALLLAACAGGDGEGAVEEEAPASAAPVASANEGFDPCTWLSAEEVEAVTGWKPAQTEPYPAAEGLGRCRYTGPAGAEFGPSGSAPQRVSVGIGTCPTNIAPCDEVPDVATSAELARYRENTYPKEGAYANLGAVITPIEGLGVPAIAHDLAGLIAIEMAIGQKRLGYVEGWESTDKLRELAVKALARMR